MSASKTPARILLLVSGSIAAFKAVALCSKLVQAGFDVEVAMSQNALQFIGVASFEGITRKKVHVQNFEVGSMMAHIDLERNCDLILNYPSTATTLSHFVHGNGSELLGAIFSAHEFKKPFWIAPAMNQAMIANPATEENLNFLGRMGTRIFLGKSGNLACGETGAGRLIEPETMLAHLQTYFLQKTEPKRILVTAGGTTEPIDPVRSIINFSTGETGFRIAQTLCNLGHDVTLVQSVHSRFADRLPKIVRYNTTKEFGEIFENKLKNNFFDVLIHSAAVADYSVENVAHSKIQGSAPLTLTLKPNPKYIARARDWSKNKKLKIISFKLTSGENDLKLSSYDSEYILHNELSEVGSQNHEGTLYERNADGNYSAKQTLKTKDELVTLIGNLVES